MDAMRIINYKNGLNNIKGKALAKSIMVKYSLPDCHLVIL